MSRSTIPLKRAIRKSPLQARKRGLVFRQEQAPALQHWIFIVYSNGAKQTLFVIFSHKLKIIFSLRLGLATVWALGNHSLKLF